MLERDIEKHLVNRVEDVGGECDKLVLLNQIGNPDRWCFFPSGFLLIVELKKKGKEPEFMQWKRINRLRQLNQTVEVVDSVEGVDELFIKYAKRIKHG